MQGRKTIHPSPLFSLPQTQKEHFEIILNQAEENYTKNRTLESEKRRKKLKEKKMDQKKLEKLLTQLNALESKLQEQKNANANLLFQLAQSTEMITHQADELRRLENANADLLLQLEQNRKANEDQSIQLAEKESELAIAINNEFECHKTIVYLSIQNAKQDEELLKLKPEFMSEKQKMQVLSQQLSGKKRLSPEESSSDVRKTSLVEQSIFQVNEHYSPFLTTEVPYQSSTEFDEDDHLVAQDSSESASPRLK